MANKKSLWKCLFPFIALLSMIVGSQITNIFSFLSKQNNIIDCQLLVIVFLTAYFYFGYSTYLLVVATVIGAIFDLYFYELLGIYTICLPVMLVIFNFLIKYIKPSITGYFILFMLSHIWIMYSTYFIQVLFHISKLDMIPYVVLYVAPSLVLNAMLDLGFLFYGEQYYFNVTKRLQP